MVKGDINGDGLLNDVDVWLLKQVVAEKFKLDDNELKAADMDNDGKPMMKDVVDLQRLLKNMIPGDVSGDRVIDGKDLELLRNEILKLLRLDSYIGDSSNNLTTTDAILLQKLIEGIIASYMENQPKRNKVTIRLDEFEKGEYLSWFITTQAAYTVTVTLKDDKMTYVSDSKGTTSIDPPLAVGSGKYIGNNLVLEISIPQSDEILTLPSMHTMISDTGKILGHSFTCCGEDWKDNDYNDFYINVVGWKSKK